MRWFQRFAQTMDQLLDEYDDVIHSQVEGLITLAERLRHILIPVDRRPSSLLTGCTTNLIEARLSAQRLVAVEADPQPAAAHPDRRRDWGRSPDGRRGAAGFAFHAQCAGILAQPPDRCRIIQSLPV